MTKLYPWLMSGALLLAGCNTSTKKQEQTTAPSADNVAATPPVAADTTAFNIQFSPQPPKDLSLGATQQQLAGFLPSTGRPPTPKAAGATTRT